MILDALRRADSERERGSVPGLHAQPVAPQSVDGARHAPPMRWHWVAIGVLAGLVAVLAWLIVGREAQRPPAVRSAETAASVAPAGSTAAAAPVASPPPAAEDRRSLPIAEAAPWPQPEPRNAAAKAVDAAAPARARPDATTPASTGAAAAGTPIYAREQLPENIRATLPALALGGSMYSSNPANRTLVVNGALFREKDQITSDLALEQIGQKTAVFRFKGYRFELAY